MCHTFDTLALALYVVAVRSNRLKCDEAPDEPPSVMTEDVLKIECNISISTNYMHTGIMDVRLSLRLFSSIELGTRAHLPWVTLAIDYVGSGPEDREAFPDA